MTHENSHRTNILGPKHFIVEEENEALLAKELQEAKIQSAHNSHSSMHSSQPQIFQIESNNFSMKNSTVKILNSKLKKKNVTSICLCRHPLIAQECIPNHYHH